MKPHYKILSTPGFILGLILLLLNDWVLKDLFHNWATGKLSDFAGMFVFPLFWVALFPRLGKHAFWASALWFVYWKSPYSQSLIDSWNGLELYSIYRVVDLTDLLALVMVPLAYRYWKGSPRVVPFRLHPVVPLGVAAFAFMATSYNNMVQPKEGYLLPFPKDSFNMWLPQQDSVKMLTGLDADNPDTISFWLSSLSFDKGNTVQYEMQVSVAGLSNGQTLLTLNTIYGGHEKEDSILKHGLNDFNELVINPLLHKHRITQDSIRNIP